MGNHRVSIRKGRFVMTMRFTFRMLLLFALLCAALPAANLRIQSEAGRIDLLEGDKLVTSFHYEAKWDKPFLYPLKTPSGLVISRGFPVEQIAGESNDHPFHRGIWYGGELEGGDFWREGQRTPTGRIVVQGAPKTTTERDGIVISVVANFVAPGDKILGSMTQEYVIRRAGTSYLIDAVMSLRADKGEAIKVRGTEECCMGIRLADEFRQDRGAALRNSEGLAGTENIWGKQAKWTDYSTTRQGVKAGAAIFDHPSNPRHPTYWHARGYAMNAANPVGTASFTKDKTRDGSLAIPAGDQVKFHYRFVLHDGDMEEAGIAKLYDAFAKEKTRGK
jgi:hypothetical protein